MKKKFKIFSEILLIIILTILTNKIALADSWVDVGNSHFSIPGSFTSSYPYMAIDSGTPYVAFSNDPGMGAGKANLMKLVGSTWTSVGSTDFSAGVANYVSLAFDSSHTPYVGYVDWGNGKVTVMKYNGSSWVNVGSAGFSAGIAEYTSLAIYSGTPYIAYEDYSNSHKTTVMKYNGSSWVVVGSAGFSAGTAHYQSLTFDSTGTPYVAYKDVSNSNKVTVMKYNGSSWVVVGSAGFSAGVSDYISLKLDSSNTPYVAYEDSANSQKTTVMKYNGSSWVNVGSAGFSAGQATDQSLAFDSTGTPHVSYEDWSNFGMITVMKYNGSSWVEIGPVSSLYSSGYATTIIIDSTDTPYVSYIDDNDSLTVRKLVSSSKNVSTFSILGNSGTVDNNAHTVAVSVPYGTSVTSLTPTITVSNNATISPLSGVAQNFTSPVTYTVTAQDASTQAYVVTVTVSAGVPTMTTQSASSVTQTTATLNGNITAINGATPTVRGFNYGTTVGYGTNTTASGSFSTGAYTANITGLTCNTTYHYRSYSTNSAGTGSGSDTTFTTSSCDTTAPIISELTPVTTPTSDSTPNYTFTTDEAGTVSYGGLCSSATTSASVGSNTITFTTLTDGTYSNCTITVTDAATNASTPLSVTTFVVDTAVPTLSSISASVTTTTANITWTTNEQSSTSISYGLTSSYGTNTTETDTSTRVTSHSVSISNLTCNTVYHYTVISKDATLNTSSDTDHSFTTSSCPGSVPIFVLQNIQPVQNVINSNIETNQVINNLGTSSNVIPQDFQFTKTLIPQRVDSEVQKLQIFLNTQGISVAKTGPGSIGKETLVFGPATKQALIKFQKANNLKPDGILGPKTRATINKVMKK